MKSLKQTIYLETSEDFDFWCTFGVVAGVLYLLSHMTKKGEH